MNCEFLTFPPAPDASVRAAIRITAPETVTRIPTHFILLIDVSESMLDDRKLENVKRCASLLLNFLKEDDTISLISFGEEAKLHLKHVSADEGNKATIKQAIQNLQCSGCTNLSAGLGYVRTVCEGQSQKTGLLLLTDGHANRGVSEPSELRRLMGSVCTIFPQLSVHCIAYGADHNQELMRAFAEDNRGSYNVVSTIEDTAFAFGDTLGGLMSCAYQNVRVEVPIGTNVLGPHKVEQLGGRLWITLGDVYSGTKPLVLFTLPHGEMDVSVHGMTLPDLSPWSIHPIPDIVTERQKDIHITQLRYMCTHILEGLNKWNTKDAAQREKLKEDIETFTRDVQDPFFDGDPIAALLRDEVGVIRNLLSRAESGYIDREAQCLTTQHITSIGLARGFSSPMAAHRRQTRFPRAPSRPMMPREQFGRGIASDDESDSDPIPMSAPVLSTAFQNRLQSQIATQMREAFEHEDEDEH